MASEICFSLGRLPNFFRFSLGRLVNFFTPQRSQAFLFLFFSFSFSFQNLNINEYSEKTSQKITFSLSRVIQTFFFVVRRGSPIIFLRAFAHIINGRPLTNVSLIKAQHQGHQPPSSVTKIFLLIETDMFLRMWGASIF